MNPQNHPSDPSADLFCRAADRQIPQTQSALVRLAALAEGLEDLDEAFPLTERGPAGVALAHLRAEIDELGLGLEEEFRRLCEGIPGPLDQPAAVAAHVDAIAARVEACLAELSP